MQIYQYFQKLLSSSFSSILTFNNGGRVNVSTCLVMVKVSDGVHADDFWLTMEKQYFPCVVMPTALSGYKQLLLRKLFYKVWFGL